MCLLRAGASGEMLRGAVVTGRMSLFKTDELPPPVPLPMGSREEGFWETWESITRPYRLLDVCRASAVTAAAAAVSNPCGSFTSCSGGSFTSCSGKLPEAFSATIASRAAAAALVSG